jgi:hypothetical protein
MHIDIIQRPLSTSPTTPTVNLGGHQIWLTDSPAAPAAPAEPPLELHFDFSALKRVAPSSIDLAPRRQVPFADDVPTLSVRRSW